MAQKNCCFKPETAVEIRKTRVSFETIKKEKIAFCPNCGKKKEIMDTEKVRYGE